MSEADFFKALNKRAENDAAVIAALRRSAAYDPGLFPAVFPYVEPFVHHLTEWRRTATYLTAACWALAARREKGETQELPLALRTLQLRSSNASKSIESRFLALLDADTDELQWRLRHLTNQVSAAGIAIDWPSLLRDLRRWPDPRRRVQVHWARQFWSPSGDPVKGSKKGDEKSKTSALDNSPP
jgi:CRISPR system Cascade subunit CasB